MPAWNELLKPPLEARRYLSPFTIKYGSDEMADLIEQELVKTK